MSRSKLFFLFMCCAFAFLFILLPVIWKDSHSRQEGTWLSFAFEQGDYIIFWGRREAINTKNQKTLEIEHIFWYNDGVQII